MLISDSIKNNFKNSTANKFYAVMLFETELNLGKSSIPNKWVNVRNIITDNGVEALTLYSNIPNPASQIVDAKNLDELESNMQNMINNYNNPQWLEENLYPYI